MALKDWKVERIYPDGINYSNFGKTTDYTVIRIDWFKIDKYGVRVQIADKYNYPIENKDFQTKSDALNFAKSWMRRH